MAEEPRPPPSEFARRARARAPGLLANLWGLLRRHRKWWLTPILLVLLLIGALLILSATPLGPFLYPLF